MYTTMLVIHAHVNQRPTVIARNTVRAVGKSTGRTHEVVAITANIVPSCAATGLTGVPADASTTHVIADEAGFFADPFPAAVYYDPA